MSEFDNLYLCPRCDHIAPFNEEGMVCEKCAFEDCYVARHINEGTRKFWINKEEELDDWRFEKRFSSIIKKAVPDDKDLVKSFNKSVKEIFRMFNENRENMQDIFPSFVRDYKRTTGERERGFQRKKHTKPKRSMYKQKQNSLRGMIYEGAMKKFCTEHILFDIVRLPITYFDKGENEHRTYEPDFWFLYDNLEIPVEFKTYSRGDLVKSRFIKGIKQSRKYGHLSFLTHSNPNKYSAIIVCCPEEKKFSCALVGENTERI